MIYMDERIMYNIAYPIVGFPEGFIAELEDGVSDIIAKSEDKFPAVGKTQSGGAGYGEKGVTHWY